MHPLQKKYGYLLKAAVVLIPLTLIAVMAAAFDFKGNWGMALACAVEISLMMSLYLFSYTDNCGPAPRH